MLEEGDKKRQNIEEGSIDGKDEKHQLTCIISVGHEVSRINNDLNKRSNNERAETYTRTAKSCKVNHAHIEQDTNTSQADKSKKAESMQIMQDKSKSSKSLYIK
eukprot:15157167-Heterocapsa_arctica.AAC.1